MVRQRRAELLFHEYFDDFTTRDLEDSEDHNGFFAPLMSKETSHYIGAGIGGSIGLGLTLASPWSRRTRCSAVLMIPSLFTMRGRSFMLTFVTGLVLTGPVNTFQYNLQEVVGKTVYFIIFDC